MGAVRPFLPVRSRSTNGTPLSATPHTPTLQIDPKGLTTDLQLVKNPASRVPASRATSSRIAGRHHLGISGRLRRNLHYIKPLMLAGRPRGAERHLYEAVKMALKGISQALYRPRIAQR